MPFKMHKNIFFPENKELKKNMCAYNFHPKHIYVFIWLDNEFGLWIYKGKWWTKS